MSLYNKNNIAHILTGLFL